MSCCVWFGGHIVCTGVGEPAKKGGKRKMAVKKPKGKIGKSVKRK